MNPLSGVLSESWQLYKAHARHLLTIAFVVYVITSLLSALLREVGGFFGVALGELITVIAVYLLEAALVKAVQDVRDGRADLSVGQTFSAATPYLGPVVIASILAGIAIFIGLVLVIIPGLFLITAWCLIVPVIVLERAGAFASFGRSWQLVKTSFWNVFGTLVLVFIILLAVDIVLGVIFLALPTFLTNFLATVISGTLVAPFIAVVVTLMYFRLSAVTVGDPAMAGGPYGAAGPYGATGQYGAAGQYGAPAEYANQGTGFPPSGPSDQSFPPPGPTDQGFPPPGTGPADTGYPPPGTGPADTGYPPPGPNPTDTGYPPSS